MLDVDPAYNQTIKGLGNLQCVKKAPLMVSHPRFYDLDPNALKFLQLPAGVPAGTKDRTVYVEMDPMLGTALRGHLMLQVNLAFDGGLVGLTNNTENLGRKFIMPVLYVDKYAELNAAKAQDYKDTIVWAMDLAPKVFLGLVISGSVLLAAAIALLIVAILKCSADGGDVSSSTGARPGKRGSIKLEDVPSSPTPMSPYPGQTEFTGGR